MRKTATERGKVFGKNGAGMRYIRKTVAEASLERIRHLYDTYDNISVQFSGGKDSMAAMEMTLMVAEERGKLPLRVIFFDEEAIYRDTIEYCEALMDDPRINFEWYCVPIKHRNGLSFKEPWWYPWAPEDKHKWVRDLPPWAITEIPGYDYTDPDKRLPIKDISGALYPPEQGTAAAVLGFRAEESQNRQRAVSTKAVDNYIVQLSSKLGHGNVVNAYPVYDWKVGDIWTAASVFGWRYNAAYDKLEMAGIPRMQQRLAPPFGEQSMADTDVIAQLDPELWAKTSSRVQGANTGALYSDTVLYGKRTGKDEAVPGPGETWADLIEHALSRHAMEARRIIAYRIRKEIERHHNKTGGEPILTSIHPETGLHWPFLYKMAYQGDLKGRYFSSNNIASMTRQRLAKLRREYYEELNAVTRYRLQKEKEAKGE